MYECPLCRKTSNRKGDTFDTTEQVIGHIDGSHDPNHEGATGEECREDIVAVEAPADDDQDSVDESFEEEPVETEPAETEPKEDGYTADSEDTAGADEPDSEPATDEIGDTTPDADEDEATDLVGEPAEVESKGQLEVEAEGGGAEEASSDDEDQSGSETADVTASEDGSGLGALLAVGTVLFVLLRRGNLDLGELSGNRQPAEDGPDIV